MLKLDNVTLLALGSTEIQENLMSLKFSMKNISFGDVKFISHEEPKKMPSQIKYEKFIGFDKIDYKEF